MKNTCTVCVVLWLQVVWYARNKYIIDIIVVRLADQISINLEYLHIEKWRATFLNVFS